MQQLITKTLLFTEGIRLSKAQKKRILKKKSSLAKITAAWAIELEKMQPDQQLFAKKGIKNILFEGQLGTLRKDSIQINVRRTSPPFIYLPPLEYLLSPRFMYDNHL